MHTSANTIRSSRGVTVLVPEFTRLRGPPNEIETGRFTGISGSGETRTRTGDTTIFTGPREWAAALCGASIARLWAAAGPAARRTAGGRASRSGRLGDAG